LSYWALLSFIFAIVLVLYIQFAFGVDYFENYRTIAQTRRLSEFYRKMGDNLIGRSEWEAAEESYRNALEIDKNNMQAAYGIAKSQVLQPVKGEKYSAPEVVFAKLDYMLKDFPNDYLLFFLKSQYYLGQQDYKNAMVWINKSIEQNPNYSWSYITRGYLEQANFNVQRSMENYKKALDIDTDNFIANNNLGFIYLTEAEFDQAVQYLEKSYNISPRLLTALNIADAYRYLGDIRTSLIYRKIALKVVEDPDEEKERYISAGGTWMYNYMPLKKGDKKTVKNYVLVPGIVQKRILVYYGIAIDYALDGDLQSADQMFDKGKQLDIDNEYGDFFINKMQSLHNFVSIDSTTTQWMIAKIAVLSKK
jgi:tetratricopeptide (TPR) repeat protein